MPPALALTASSNPSGEHHDSFVPIVWNRTLLFLSRIGIAGALYIFVLVRFGFLAFFFMYMFVNFSLYCILTTDLSAWYSGRTLLLTMSLAGLALYGYLIAKPSGGPSPLTSSA